MDVNCQIHTMEQMLSAMVIKVWSLQASSENVLKKYKLSGSSQTYWITNTWGLCQQSLL